MEQHPIPQQISSYQFRLVGDMTLKQFFQLAGGALVGLLIYATPVHPIIKWPLIIFFGLLGAALAFLPFEERPLEQWIVAFFRSIYSPTLFYWQKGVAAAEVFLPEGGAPVSALVAAKPTGGNVFTAKLEEAEEKFLSSLTGALGGSGAGAGQPAVTSMMAAPSSPIAGPVANGAKAQLQIPTAPKLQVEEQASLGQRGIVELTPGSGQAISAQAVGGVLVGQAVQGAGAAQFSTEAAPPMPPERPNTVVGQVMDPEGKIVEGAILEIKDMAGVPVRALKTNKAGHFMIVTPLANGDYEMVIEKEGLIFEPVRFSVTGVIIAPIAIRAKGRETATAQA